MLHAAVTQAEHTAQAAAEEALLARAQEAACQPDVLADADQAQQAQNNRAREPAERRAGNLWRQRCRYRDECGPRQYSTRARATRTMPPVERQLAAAREAEQTAPADTQRVAEQALAQARVKRCGISRIRHGARRAPRQMEERLAQPAAARDTVRYHRAARRACACRRGTSLRQPFDGRCGAAECGLTGHRGSATGAAER